MSRQLLAISWDMPPLSGPRAVQVSRTLKHLVPLGWESTVICFGSRSHRYQQDFELADRLRAPGVRLAPVPSLEERLPFRALWRLAPPLKLLPDEKWVWIGPASRAARKAAAARRFDVLVSFAQPWSDHLIGLRVHRATKLPWVAHFSDPWTDSPYLRGRPWQQHLWRRMEADVIREATALVFVNRQTADRVMSKYPAEWRPKAHVVPHAFDLGEPRARPRVNGAGRALRVVYTGRFYERLRTPEGLLRALASLARRRPIAEDVHVTFVGTPVPAYVRFADRLGLSGVVEFTGRVSFAESERLAAGADVLLVVDAPADDNLFLPSKLIDYLPLAKPIIGLTPFAGATADVLRALGQPIVPPNDDAAIAAAIEKLIDLKRAGLLSVPASYSATASRYDVRTTARSFADVLEGCA
jgi:glycosyltransferase involved in cell wall biosynthesis